MNTPIYSPCRRISWP